VAFERDRLVADGIDAHVNRVEPSDSAPVVDRIASETEPLQLADRDQPMLSAGEPCYPPIDMHGWSRHPARTRRDHRAANATVRWPHPVQAA
jgi:hypothetical protein